MEEVSPTTAARTLVKTFTQKLHLLHTWLPYILVQIKDDLRADHLEVNPSFVMSYFPQYYKKMRFNPIPLHVLVSGYHMALAKESAEDSEGLATIISQMWILKHADIYDLFEERFTALGIDFEKEMKILSQDVSKQLIADVIKRYGPLDTYLFVTLNSVLLESTVLEHLHQEALDQWSVMRHPLESLNDSDDDYTDTSDSELPIQKMQCLAVSSDNKAIRTPSPLLRARTMSSAELAFYRDGDPHEQEDEAASYSYQHPMHILSHAHSHNATQSISPHFATPQSYQHHSLAMPQNITPPPTSSSLPMFVSQALTSRPQSAPNSAERPPPISLTPNLARRVNMLKTSKGASFILPRNDRNYLVHMRSQFVEGFLYKKTKAKTAGNNRSSRPGFVRKWAALREAKLYYYKSREQKEMSASDFVHACIPLVYVTHIRTAPELGEAAFAISTITRKFVFKCDSAEECKNWLLGIHSSLAQIVTDILSPDSHQDRMKVRKIRRWWKHKRYEKPLTTSQESETDLPPIVVETVRRIDGLNFVAVAAYTQGQREQMEDQHCIIPDTHVHFPEYAIPRFSPTMQISLHSSLTVPNSNHHSNSNNNSPTPFSTRATTTTSPTSSSTTTNTRPLSMNNGTTPRRQAMHAMLSASDPGYKNRFAESGEDSADNPQDSPENSRQNNYISNGSTVPRAFFAVFDGHGGVEAAVYAKQHLARNIFSNAAFDIDPKGAITEAFAKTDKGFIKIAKENEWYCGTTAIACIWQGNKLIVANLGDSRAALCNGQGISSPLSADHKPSREDERKRIQDAGGWVVDYKDLNMSQLYRINPELVKEATIPSRLVELVGFVTTSRVCGELAVSRALGDMEYKGAEAEEYWEAQFSDDLVLAVPDVHMDLLSNKDSFLLLACDGLWDVFTTQEAADIIWEGVTQQRLSPGNIATRLITSALHKGSMDNISIVIVFVGAFLAAHNISVDTIGVHTDPSKKEKSDSDDDVDDASESSEGEEEEEIDMENSDSIRDQLEKDL